jgi:hypothetical protein
MTAEARVPEGQDEFQDMNKHRKVPHRVLQANPPLLYADPYKRSLTNDFTMHCSPSKTAARLAAKGLVDRWHIALQ